MIAIVVVYDESSSGERLNTVRLRLPTMQVSLRDLIRARVQQEAQRFNLERPVVFRALVQPSEAQEIDRGFRLAQHRDVDWERQADAALDAFGNRSFFVLLNGRDVDDLDASVDLSPPNEISFVRMMPVIGG